MDTPASSLPQLGFASDNTAGASPQILAALLRANEGQAPAYGADDITLRVERRLAALFERDVDVLLVPTGTAANSVALAALTPPWGSVLCLSLIHI